MLSLLLFYLFSFNSFICLFSYFILFVYFLITFLRNDAIPVQILRRAPVGRENDPLLPVPSSGEAQGEPVALYFSAVTTERVVSVSGAGDWWVIEFSFTVF